MSLASFLSIESSIMLRTLCYNNVQDVEKLCENFALDGISGCNKVTLSEQPEWKYFEKYIRLLEYTIVKYYDCGDFLYGFDLSTLKNPLKLSINDKKYTLKYDGAAMQLRAEQ